MKTKIRKILCAVMVAILVVCLCIAINACTPAEIVKHNIQRTADKFDTFRRITFVNLQTGELLYSAEGYFSLQTTVENTYQGQQEIGLIFKTGGDQYQMHYFSINNNVAYVIEQTENTTTDPYHWKIVWYVPLPTVG